MIKGYYTAVSAMAAMLAEQQIIGNNLANLNTIGYKQDVPQSEQFEQVLLFTLRRDRGLGAIQAADGIAGEVGSGIELLPVALDLTPGTVSQTGRPLDMALVAGGFFQLRQADGTQTYTRAGAFDLDVNGLLVNRLGEAVLDVNGQSISIGAGDIIVRSDGVIFVNGAQAAQVAIVDLPPGEEWKKVGLSHFKPVHADQSPQQVSTPRMLQGYLEQANVDAEFQMVEMLSVLRIFEAAQALVQMEDESLSQAVREVGRVQ